MQSYIIFDGITFIFANYIIICNVSADVQETSTIIIMASYFSELVTSLTHTYTFLQNKKALATKEKINTWEWVGYVRICFCFIPFIIFSN